MISRRLSNHQNIFHLLRTQLHQTRTFHQTPTKLQEKSPDQIAEAFLSKFANGQTFTRQQLLDPNQLRLFSLTLNRKHLWPGQPSLEREEPKSGTPIPAGYHNAYFTPTQSPEQLGIDGTDTSYNPEPPFTRRMWAGGSITWSSPSTSLKTNDLATETTNLLSCIPKTIKKTGEKMLLVSVEKTFHNSSGDLCITDNRNWIFREALDPFKKATSPAKPKELSEAELNAAAKGKLIRKFKRDEAQLFRFSALTFNAHRIHYDKVWATNVEGHRDIVVHGPLNMISILDFWRDEYLRKIEGGGGDGVVFPKELKYRATSPVYVGEGYRILIDEVGVQGEEVPVEVVSDDGTVCMKGEVRRW